jgi:hypothetical protein
MPGVRFAINQKKSGHGVKAQFDIRAAIGNLTAFDFARSGRRRDAASRAVAASRPKELRLRAEREGGEANAREKPHKPLKTQLQQQA